MQTKLLTAIHIVMFYASFMAPFVLKAPAQRSQGSPSSLRRNLGDMAADIFTVVAIITILALLIGGIIMLCFGNPLGILLIVGAFILGLTGNRVAKELKKWRNLSSDRRLSLAAKSNLSDAEKAKLLDKARKYEQKLDEELNLGKAFLEAQKENYKTKALKLLRQYGLKKKKIEPGLTHDQMKIELRDLFDIELFDLVTMNKELDKFKTMSDVEKWHGPQKIRRNYWKQRIRRTVNFIQQEFYDQKKWETSWERKYGLYQIELEPKVNSLKSPNLSDDERKKINDEIQEVIMREDHKISHEERISRDAKIVDGYYDAAGMNSLVRKTFFFTSYRRAALATLLKIEKIYHTQSLHDTPLTDEQRKKTNDAIQIIDDKIADLSKGNDLD